MLTTISEQSQLLSPKKLLALQRQVSISDTQQRQVFVTCIGKGSSLSSEDNNQISPKGFSSENSSTPIKKQDNNSGSAVVTSSASNVDSNQLIDEKCHHEGHRTIFSAASVGNHIMIEFLRNSLSIILFL